MIKSIKNFKIYNMIYDKEKQDLSFEFDMDGRKAKCQCTGVLTINDILNAVEEVIDTYYTTET